MTLLLALSLSPLSAQARTLAAIESTHLLRVGLTGDYAPYSLRQADGTLTGADVTMARVLAGRLGVALEIVTTSWKSMAGDLAADRFDIAMGGVSVTAERAEIGDFSVTVVSDGKRPIVRCADRDRYTSIAAIDRPEVRVAVDPGGTNEAFAEAHFGKARIEEIADNREIFDDLAAGRADVMVTDGAEVDYQAARHRGILCPAAVPQSFDHVEKAYWMTRDPALKAAVDGVVRESLASGEYRRFLAAPGGPRRGGDGDK